LTAVGCLSARHPAAVSFPPRSRSGASPSHAQRGNETAIAWFPDRNLKIVTPAFPAAALLPTASPGNEPPRHAAQAARPDLQA